MRGTYVLSYGAGVNTSALMVLLVRRRMPFDIAVFADTGAELPETYEYLEVATEYLSKHGIELKVVKSENGTLYDTCKRRKVIPSKFWRWSTRDYKIRPIHRFYKSLGTHVIEYIGIGYDEIERLKESREPYITSRFPLIDFKMTRADCVSLIKSARLPVPIKSGCYICPFMDIPRWKYIYENHKTLYTKAMKLEEGSKHFPDQKLNVHTLRGLMDNRFVDGVASKDPARELCGGYCMI